MPVHERAGAVRLVVAQIVAGKPPIFGRTPRLLRALGSRATAEALGPGPLRRSERQQIVAVVDAAQVRFSRARDHVVSRAHLDHHLF